MTSLTEFWECRFSRWKNQGVFCGPVISPLIDFHKVRDSKTALTCRVRNQSLWYCSMQSCPNSSTLATGFSWRPTIFASWFESTTASKSTPQTAMQWKNRSTVCQFPRITSAFGGDGFEEENAWDELAKSMNIPWNLRRHDRLRIQYRCSHKELVFPSPQVEALLSDNSRRTRFQGFPPWQIDIPSQSTFLPEGWTVLSRFVVQYFVRWIGLLLWRRLLWR